MLNSAVQERKIRRSRRSLSSAAKKNLLRKFQKLNQNDPKMSWTVADHDFPHYYGQVKRVVTASITLTTPSRKTSDSSISPTAPFSPCSPTYLEVLPTSSGVFQRPRSYSTLTECSPSNEDLKTKVKRWDSLRKSIKTSSEKLVELAGTRVKRSNTVSVPRAALRSRRTSIATTNPRLYDSPNFLLPKFKKCDSSASLSSTDSCEWDERKRTISANIKRKLGSVSSRKQATENTGAQLMSGVNLKEALICQFPDGTEEIGAAQKGKSLREMLSPIFDRRNMSMNEYAVFLEQSNTPLLYSFDTFPLAGQTLLIQGNHYDATNEFTYNATSSFSRPRLHDPGSVSLITELELELEFIT
ncbi:hypothetical protein ACHWQZ_G015022 [Mnemiopsis leidyi]